MVYMFLTFLNFLHINNKKNNEKQRQYKIKQEIQLRETLSKNKTLLTFLKKDTEAIDNAYQKLTERLGKLGVIVKNTPRINEYNANNLQMINSLQLIHKQKLDYFKKLKLNYLNKKNALQNESENIDNFIMKHQNLLQLYANEPNKQNFNIYAENTILHRWFNGHITAEKRDQELKRIRES